MNDSVPPNTRLDELHELWDLIVIGAGPAGCIAAKVAASGGLSVLLVEKAAFPRPKVCGCCLNEAALASLAFAGVIRHVEALAPNPLNTLLLTSRRRSASFSLRPGWAVSRSAMDEVLAAAAVEAGAMFLDGCTAAVAAANSDSRAVSLTSHQVNRTLRARAVVAADGLSGTSLAGVGDMASSPRAGSRVGLGALLPTGANPLEPGVIRMVCAAAGYVGAVDLEDGSTALAAAIDDGYLRSRGGPPRAIRSLLEESGSPIPAELDSARWRGTPALSRSRGLIERDRLFVIGDAAGYVEPFTGEGMSWAIRSGVSIVNLVHQQVRDRYVPGSWTRERRRFLHSRQWRCGLVCSLLRRPRLVNAAINLARLAPASVRTISRSFGAPWPGHASAGCAA